MWTRTVSRSFTAKDAKDAKEASHADFLKTSREVLALFACIAYALCMQYTIRGVPAAVDSALRERARSSRKSLNEAAVEALTEGSGASGAARKRRDLSDVAGTWKADKAVEAALAAQDKVDEDLW